MCRSTFSLRKSITIFFFQDKCESAQIDVLIEKIKERWDVWDVSDGVQDSEITFDAFYNGFMAPYFGCYRCEDTQQGGHLVRSSYAKNEVYYQGKNIPKLD